MGIQTMGNSMPTVVLDLDDVVANLRDSLYQILSAASGRAYHWQQWQHYDLARHYPELADRLEALLVAERALERCLPEAGAAAATLALQQAGWQVAIVTARGWHPQAYAVTEAWLQQHAIVYQQLRVVPLGGDKRSVLAELGEVRLAVDDHPTHIERYRQSGINTLLMDRPWNRQHPHPARIQHLEQALAWLR